MVPFDLNEQNFLTLYMLELTPLFREKWTWSLFVTMIHSNGISYIQWGAIWLGWTDFLAIKWYTLANWLIVKASKLYFEANPFLKLDNEVNFVEWDVLHMYQVLIARYSIKRWITFFIGFSVESMNIWTHSWEVSHSP